MFTSQRSFQPRGTSVHLYARVSFHPEILDVWAWRIWFRCDRKWLWQHHGQTATCAGVSAACVWWLARWVQVQRRESQVIGKLCVATICWASAARPPPLSSCWRNRQNRCCHRTRSTRKGTLPLRQDWRHRLYRHSGYDAERIKGLCSLGGSTRFSGAANNRSMKGKQGFWILKHSAIDGYNKENLEIFQDKTSFTSAV